MTTRIDLTNEEIEILLTGLVVYKNALQENIELLEKAWSTEVTNKLIAQKIILIASCDNLFDKLYEAQKKL